MSPGPHTMLGMPARAKRPASVPYATLRCARSAVSARTSCVIAACSLASRPGAAAIFVNSMAADACSRCIFGSSVSRAYCSTRAKIASGSSEGRLRNSNVKRHSAGTVLIALPPSIRLVCAVVNGTS
jgi:hypothetical protein